MSRLSALLYDLVLERTESSGLSAWREELLAPLGGRVLEIGAGTGRNLPYYRATVTELVLVEPDRHMRRRMATRMHDLPAPVTVVSTSAERIPYRDQSFDAAVVTLVLCTVPEPDAVLAELTRVLRPNGRLVIIEHVGAVPHSPTARLQHAIEPLWRRVAGNCHLTRDTARTLARAGFDTTEVTARRLPAAPAILRPAIAGPTTLASVGRRSGS